MPDAPQDPRMFWYASFSGLWIYFEVDAGLLQNYFNESILGDYMQPALFDGKAAVNLCFMSYASHSGMNDAAAYTDMQQPLPDPVPAGWLPPGFGVEPTNECEFNAVCYPKTFSDNVSEEGITTLRQFVLGADVAKVIGHYRLRVPCDDRIAVFYGKNFIGENKVLTHPFRYNVPAINNPGRDQWNVVVPGPLTGPASSEMFTLNVDVSSLPSIAANTSEVVNYSDAMSYPGVLQQRRNLFGVFDTYFLDDASSRGLVNLCYGNDSDQMVVTMKALLGENPVPLIVQTFTSVPAASETPTILVAGGP